MSALERDDPEVAALVERERARQRATLNLIASENTAPAAVNEALGSIFGNKTAEGYPGRRYHRGTAVTDELETLAIERAKALFGADHANVQVHAGVNANLAVYQAVLRPGDRVIALDLDHGGHLSHGASASITSRILDVRHYGVRPDTEQIDLDDVRALALEHRPRMIVTGGSSYPRRIDYAGFRAVADEVGAVLLVDMAHIAGLVAADVLPSPVPHADFVTLTTYKTLNGPHGGIVLCRTEHARALDRAVFPGTQGAPSVSQIAAKAVALQLATTPAFREVQARTVRNAGVLAAALARSRVPDRHGRHRHAPGARGPALEGPDRRYRRSPPRGRRPPRQPERHPLRPGVDHGHERDPHRHPGRHRARVRRRRDDDGRRPHRPDARRGARRAAGPGRARDGRRASARRTR